MENELSEYDYDNADLFRKIARNARLVDEDYYLNLVEKLNKDMWIHPPRALSLRLVDHMDLPVISKRVTLNYTIQLPCKEPSPNDIQKMLDKETNKQGLPLFGPAPVALGKDQQAPYYECVGEEKRLESDKNPALVEVVGISAEKISRNSKLPGSLLDGNYY
jgi:hypothetical protein